ncbi:MAG TPA: family 10 glycosylhydrolase [Ferruginibacter sp.]|nr:family 10 glycosylhydrolase [Ferruginibacter sp.]HRO17255.1 family 10 glycosylhydrolase [Ferruginibacter sp.]HRQ20871.1 family 10 glycosylhydrolase [Ferruginibacter sp.]
MLKHFLLIVIVFIGVTLTTHAQKREMRGVWLTTFSNIDWPQRNQSPEQQQQALIRLLNMYQSVGLNTVYLQVRSQCDALYPSTIEPWTADLTGTQGKAPEPLWDPLQFAIEECRKRSLELHAWINPYRAVTNTGALPYFSTEHIARKHPSWLLGNGTLRVLNPARQEVREHIKKVISDILNRYDVDGIHFDDYFYPEGPLNDEADFRANSRGFTNKADWRRDNVNILIRDVSNLINRTKPWVKFGVSPTGIYMNSSKPELGTPTTGLQHFSELYCDSRKWLNEGWVDYIAPQVYWHYQQAGSPFKVVTPWWDQQAGNRLIYIGIGGYKVGVWPGWNSSSEIPNQLRLSLRSGFKHIQGISVYNTSSLLENKLGFRDSIAHMFKQPALQPLMPWRDSVAPPPPGHLQAVPSGQTIRLSWAPPAAPGYPANDVHNYAIYRSSSYPVTIQPQHLLRVIPAWQTFYDSSVRVFDSVYYYTVTALDRLHNESTPSNMASTARKDLPVVQIRLYKNEKGSAALRWTDSKPLNATRYVLERSENNEQFRAFLDLGQVSPVQLPQLDTVSATTWFRVRREGTDAIAYSESLAFHPAPVVKSQPPPTIPPVRKEPEPIAKAETPKAPEKQEEPQPVTPVKAPEQPEPVKTPPSQQEIWPTTGAITKPVDRLVVGNSLRINILVVGEVQYYLLNEKGDVITSGKIWSRSPSAYATIPSSNSLPAGMYRLQTRFGDEKDGWAFKVE